MTGKWNEAMSYQPCDMEGEPLPGTVMKEVNFHHKHFFFEFNNTALDLSSTYPQDSSFWCFSLGCAVM